MTSLNTHIDKNGTLLSWKIYTDTLRFVILLEGWEVEKEAVTHLQERKQQSVTKTTLSASNIFEIFSVQYAVS